ncbi:glycosyltransferase [Streptococcus uberis]|uniref:glycosyltransferase n=1 Tax=Streptococcus uberis TaxID=1349 RepID=UPI00378D54B0
MVKVLHTIPALDGGGADRVIYDYCVRMIPDIQFDFIVHSETKGILETELESLGCNIFHIKPARDGFFKYLKSIFFILKSNKYDMIHVSQGFWGFWFIFLSKFLGIKIRIAHAHMANLPETKNQFIKRFIFSKLTELFSTDLFACGEDAAKWMWGEKNFNRNKVRIMVNAIDGKKFDFNPKLREELRNQWDITDDFVIGNVGRLTYQKNQTFLIDVFSEIHKSNPKSKLFLIGRGDMEDELKNKVKQLRLDDSVIFTGVRKDVDYLLNMLDIFVLPSHFEGLPITLIEVQMNGLPTVVSENITKESKFSENYISLSLKESAEFWAKKILGLNMNRSALPEKMRQKRDVNYLAGIQKEWYLKRMEKK